MEASIKKFLIISSYAPPAVSGSPLLMGNLLHYFPPDSFSILTSHAGTDARATVHGKRLPAKYFYFDTPATTFTDHREHSFFEKCKAIGKKIPVIRSVGELTLLFGAISNIVAKGMRIVKESGSELLVGYSDYGAALIGTYALHKKTGLPYYLYFYDLYAGTKLPFFSRMLAGIMEPRLFRSAERVFVMCETLADHYEKKYGRRPVVIYNSPIIPDVQPKPDFPQEPFKVMYTGTIYWAQADAVRNLIEAVRRSKENIELWLYTPHDAAYLARLGIHAGEKIKFASGMPEEMPRIQSSAAILCVLLGFNTGYPLLINTSSPGKTYEYMLSGRPMLVHAPRGSFVAEYIKKNECGYVVDEPDPKKLREGISVLLHDRALASRLVENAWATAVRNHDAKKNAAAFRAFFET